jgi:hypothetical protein
MVKVSVFTNEIRSDGELVDRLAAAFEVRGQELTVTDGSARFIQVGMPVYSERHGGLVDFDTDGEEWARNLPTAYRNGAVNMYAEEVVEPAGRVSVGCMGAPALAVQRARQRN